MKFLTIGLLAVSVVATAANADIEVSVGGEVKFKYSDIDNNVVGGTSSTAFSTTPEVNVGALGKSGKYTYGATVDLKLDADTASIDMEETEVWVITPFGRIGGGVVPTSNRSADIIAAGESGVSTDPLGREYGDIFGGPTLSYGLKMGGFGAGVNVNAEFEPSWTVVYGGKFLGDATYEVYTRGTDRGNLFVTNPLNPTGPEALGATSYKVMQHGARVSFGDITVAGSIGSDKATDYAFLNGLQAGAAVSNDNVKRDYSNIAVRYDMGALSFSADYDQGTVNAPWVAAPTTALTAANGLLFVNPYSDADYDSWSVGMEYKIAEGLKFGAGYKQFNKGILLDLELTGAAAGGFKIKDQSEVAAALTLNF